MLGGPSGELIYMDRRYWIMDGVYVCLFVRKGRGASIGDCMADARCKMHCSRMAWLSVGRR